MRQLVDVVLVAANRRILRAELKTVGRKLTRRNRQDDDDEVVRANHIHALDVFSPCVIAQGEHDEDGNEITAPVLDHRTFAIIRCPQRIANRLPASIKANAADTEMVNNYRRFA